MPTSDSAFAQAWAAETKETPTRSVYWADAAVLVEVELEVEVEVEVEVVELKGPEDTSAKENSAPDWYGGLPMRLTERLRCVCPRAFASKPKL